MSWIRKLATMPNDRPAKTLAVAFTVALVCALIVSGTAVLLKPLQVANERRDRQQHIREIVGRLPGAETLLQTADKQAVEAHVVELATGNYVRDLDPATYDQREAARDPQMSVEIPAKHDLARLKRRAKYATVYLVKRDGEIDLIILPVHGSGYASTIYGFLALQGDANTVEALTFFEHEETPGLGAQIDDPEWRSQWQGKKARDEEGEIRIGVAKGSVEPNAPEATYQVDGISGATRTSNAVTRLLRFWLGDYGFGPFLERIRS